MGYKDFAPTVLAVNRPPSPCKFARLDLPAIRKTKAGQQPFPLLSVFVVLRRDRAGAKGEGGGERIKGAQCFQQGASLPFLVSGTLVRRQFV